MSGDTHWPRLEHPSVTVCHGHHVYVNVGKPGITWQCRVCSWVRP